MLRLITKHKEYGEFKSPEFALRSSHFYAAVLSSPSEFAIGLTISRKTGKAHLRNLLKRRVKAWLRLQRDVLPSGFKLNLVARSGAGELTWQDLCQELTDLTGQLRARS
ncbi:MAG TPA: ribonuclease P protein component [Candidatus Syntrophosphaera sp.]|jgi:ribonuclease P protein component|nr:ribonuclease P protein component [Candidatus Syntrophosphaera sp.]